jgi:hypothetical protein
MSFSVILICPVVAVVGVRLQRISLARRSLPVFVLHIVEQFAGSIVFKCDLHGCHLCICILEIETIGKINK